MQHCDSLDEVLPRVPTHPQMSLQWTGAKTRHSPKSELSSYTAYTELQATKLPMA